MELEKLFNYAINIIQDIQKKVNYNFAWSIGGGTILMLDFKHRKSKDIDIFLNDAQLIPYFSPRLNDNFENQILDYSEQSNFVKISLKEGEIDFIIAPYITKNPLRKLRIKNTEFLADTPEEIVYKKLFYRAESLKVRDLIDVAVVLENRRSFMIDNKNLIKSKVEILESRIRQLFQIYDDEVNNIDFLEEGLQYKNKSIQIIQSFIEN